MKPAQLFILATLIFSGNIHAQENTPKGYKKGSVVLSNGKTITGYVKDNLSNDASVNFLELNLEKKTKYNGLELLSAEIGDKKFLCIKGDFFKIISSGDLNFLQKASNVSSKPIYNGTEAIFLNGTEGKSGDYFLYNAAYRQLLWINKKNKETILSLFAGDATSLELAKQNPTDAEVIKNAVTLYNNSTSRK